LDGIDNIGVRKLAAYVRQLYPNAKVSYVIPGNFRNPLNIILARGEATLTPEEITEIALGIRGSEIIGFSSMSGYAPLVEKIIAETRKLSPESYIIWGGIHPIMNPENAILHADAVCTGEGEFAFERLASILSRGEDPTTTPGFWFRVSNKIFRNPNLPLMTSEEMELLPFALHQEGETIYKAGRGFVEMTSQDYIAYNGISYPTIWSIGCPFKCTYCGNSKFIEYDDGYRRVRHPSPEYIIAEIEAAKEKHPFISEIVFHDDSFMALKPQLLEEFANQFREKIGLPFFVSGVIPNYVRDEKIESLLHGGLNRLRMGVQSGSERILDFYKRPTPPEKIFSATQSIGKYAEYMIAPAYDIILDNPIETRDDVLATLEMIHGFPRPFTLNLFSLRIIPGTELEKNFSDIGVKTNNISSNYWKHDASFSNCLVYLLILFPIPNRIFNFLKQFATSLNEPHRQHRILMITLRIMYLSKRAGHHLRRMDFTNLPGRIGYLAWRTGGIAMWQRYFVRNYKRVNK
jgi:anaerobic magnesium-protoporphyrin IX monomethyl ester cyclase